MIKGCLLRNFLTSNSTKLKYFDKHLFLQIGLGKSNERKEKNQCKVAPRHVRIL